MAERKRIYLCLAHMSEAGLEQKYIKEAFDTNWVVVRKADGALSETWTENVERR